MNTQVDTPSVPVAADPNAAYVRIANRHQAVR